MNCCANKRSAAVVFAAFLRIRLPALALSCSLVGPPLQSLVAQQIFIRANQVGYRPGDVKIAVAFGPPVLPPRFQVIAPGKPGPVFEAQTKSLAPAGWGAFSNFVELDFSALKSPGQYQLQLGSSASLPFRVDTGAFDALPSLLLQFMRQQRCGYNPWLDAVCHPYDGRTAYGPLTNGTFLDARGGWHDAGDLLKYLLTSGNATAQMLLAYQLNAPEKHSGHGLPLRSIDADDFNALGQPGPNGIPDLLDEARWGLEWMLKLHPAPGQLYHQVADDRDHYGWRLPQDEAADYGWGKGGARVVYYADGRPQGLKQFQSASTGIANLAGRYAAAMALAYQVWKDDPRQRPFAERCLRAGKEVYELGRAQPGVQQGNSCNSPYRYEESTWADDMEWGAAELFRATGSRHYLSEAIEYSKTAGTDSWMGKDQTGHYQFYPFMNLGHFRLYGIADKTTKQRLAGYYHQELDACLHAGNRNAFHAGVPFIWCSNNLMTALATQCLLYERMTGDHSGREFAAAQRDWLLGRNPWGFSMFTGIGSISPRHTHLMTRELTGREVIGGLVDGPVYDRIFKSLKGVTITQPDPLEAFQGLAVYHDDVHDYSSNEPTMDGTASAILLWALLQSSH